MRKRSLSILAVLLACVLTFAYSISFAAASAGYSDEFTSSPLSTFWTKTGSGSATYDLTTNPGSLRITSPANLDLGGTNDNAPRILQPVTNDFSVITKITGTFSTAGVTGVHAGILVYKDSSHFVRVEVRGVNSVQIGGKNGGAFVGGPISLGSTVNPIYLKLEKVGSTITGYWSSTGAAWTSFGTFTLTTSDPVSVGLFVIDQNAAPTTFSADFDFFRIIPQNVSVLPESPIGALALPIAVIGAFAIFKYKPWSKATKHTSF